MNKGNESIAHGIIEGHRQLIFERYDYKRVKEDYHFPPSFTQEKANELRDFFMLHVYPDAEQRQQLDEAFLHLDNFIGNPSKIFRILADSVGIMFKYGRHLPSLLKAAIKAFESFRSATHIEDLLSKEAERIELLPPYSVDQMSRLMSQLPDEALIGHMESIWPLYDILLDRKLVNKILEVINSLLIRMEKHQDAYTRNEIAGIELGRDLIANAIHLFGQFSNRELGLLFREITQIEKDAYAKFLAS